MKGKIRVLVTGTGGGGLGHELIKSLRLTNRYHIIGVDMNKNSVGFLDADESYLVPKANHPDYIANIFDICYKKKVEVLLPGSDPELKIFSTHRDTIESNGIFLPINSNEVINISMNKLKTMDTLQEKGFAIPLTLLANNEEEIPKDFPLPAVIKPSIGGGGSVNIYLVQDQAEFQYACRYLIRQRIPTLIQEYVGTPESEFTVGVLHSLDGKLFGSIALRRHILSGLSNRIKVENRTNRKELSPVLAISSGISQGEIQNFPEVRAKCEEIASAIGSKGPLNIQCRISGENLYTFEINPRFSGTSHFRALLGFNEVDILIRHHLLKEQFKSPLKYRFGQAVRGLNEQII